MNVSVLYGKGLGEDPPDKADDSEGDSEMVGDDADLAELGAKYAERMGEALKSGDGKAAFAAFCRMTELHSFMEDQERGY